MKKTFKTNKDASYKIIKVKVSIECCGDGTRVLKVHKKDRGVQLELVNLEYHKIIPSYKKI